MKYKPIALATAALAAGFAVAPARAALVPLTNVQLSGQGVGASFTTLFLEGAGNAITKSGGVLFNGTPFGDVGNGQSQTRTFTFADPALTNTSQLASIVNLAEPGSENPPSVTAAARPLASIANLANTVTLTVYSEQGALLEQNSAASDLTLNQVASALGGSGIVFALATAEADQLNSNMANTVGTEVFTMGATSANAQGGPETISAVRLDSAVGEPETYVLMFAGIGVIGFLALRRGKRK